jgi:hypothetical protein
MSPVTKRGCLSNRQFRVSGFRVHGDPADASCHSHNTCMYSGGSDELMLNTGREAYSIRKHNGRNSNLEIRVSSTRQSATFLALLPSGRKARRIASRRVASLHMCALLQIPKRKSVPLSRLHLSSVSGRCAKKHKMVVWPYLMVVAPRRLLRRSGISHQAINRSTAYGIPSLGG